MLKFIICFIIAFLCQKGFCVDHRGAWIDIPTASFALPDEHRNERIITLINDYHSINKEDLNLIPKRITILDQIHQEITKIENGIESHLKSKFQKLDVLVQKKSWYLEQIQLLYNNPSPYKNFLDVGSVNTPFTPLIFVNKVFFDFKLPIYWGLSWLEVLDPCHRFLTAHYLKWKKKNSTIPFFLWLEEQEIPYNAIQVDFLNEGEIDKYQLRISDGLFIHDTNNEIVNYENPNQEYIFVMTLDKKLIVIEGNERIRHSSITHGKPVLGVGAIKIQKGKLIYIDAESGHYQPIPEALWQVIQILNEQGVKLDYKTIQVKYYNNGHVIHENAIAFIKKYKGKQLEKPTPELLENLLKFKI